jgi:hypothetical protein
MTIRKPSLKVIPDHAKTNLPVILMELDSNFNVMKSYVYGNSQTIAQYDGNPFSANKYFYLHDRLGSVRLVINDAADDYYIPAATAQQ